MNRYKVSLLNILLFTFWSAAAQADPIIVLSKKKTKSAQELTLTADQYSTRIQKIFGSVNETVLPSLSAQESKSPGWKLKAFMIGVGLELKAGFGAIAEAKATPRFRLVYTRKGSAYFPDAD